ncbi:hypothetical protein [Staphylococcus aureus]|uniref:hypothetical protein n=1 Tax=Staphylococcus aureus TaxID=1280 RepID=UPI0012A10B8D|nr:hypothetical protein [Staphylococcus aureus]AYD82538.1 DNA polymerase beta subunit [Achromobacter phage vB_Ade_ART]MBD4204415.1 hypothetical protein [Xanthomonas citri pv. citri]
MTTLAQALKFVQGAVAKKDPLPVLTHFSIRNNRVKGYNGLVTLSSPIPLALDCQPKAIPFVKAIQTCEDTVQLSLTATGRLTVKSGKFRAHVECSPEPFPDVEPSGEFCEIKSGLVAALKVIEPLIAEDASRPWARSVLMKEGSLFATNNVAIVQYWIGHDLPGDMCISHAVVNELIRIKEDPVGIQYDHSSITFHYTEDRWLKASLVVNGWPDFERVLNVETDQSYIPPEFFPALDTLVPFVNSERDVFFSAHGVTTSLEDQEGSAVTISGWDTPIGWYDIDVLRMLAGLATSADFTRYPNPSIFTGMDGALRGAIAGKKDANYPPPTAE